MSATTPAKSQATGGYEVARPQGRCAVSGQDIQPDEKFMTALLDSPAGYQRADVSLAHWNEFDRSHVVAFWQTTMPRPEQKKKLFVDDAILCEVFERLSDVTEPAKVNFRFVLGLILMRKRLVIYETTLHESGRDIWRVRMKGKQQQLDLVDPKLNEEQMREVSQQLGEVLHQEVQ